MTAQHRKGERGMTLFAVLALMAISCVFLLTVASTVQIDIQREKEQEAIYRGEEVAEAIRQYVEFYRGAKLPNSMDDLLKGLPQGTKDRAILRLSASIDPMSEDGKWRLIQADPMKLQGFARKVQGYNGGMMPTNPSPTFDRYTAALNSSVIVNIDGTTTDQDSLDDDMDFDTITDNVPFIGVASQSRAHSVLTYYGLDTESKWIFTPLFRGTQSRIVPIRPGTLPVRPTR